MIAAVDKVSLKEARARLKDLDGWTLKGKALRREYVMRDFLAAIEFLHEVAQAAESSDHHPDLHLTGYRRLAIELTSHDAGGLTDRDFALAARIDALPRKLKKKENPS